MRFIVSTSTLKKHLQAINGASSTSTVLPILENFLFAVSNGELTLSATDLQTSMTTSFTIETRDEGKIAVPSKILLETLKNLPDVPVTFNIDMSTYAIEISAGEGKYTLTGENGDDFPKIPEVDDAQAISLPASILTDAIAKTIFAVSNDELRPAMTGVYCQLSPESITFVSTDAHKLVRYRRNDAHSEQASNFILPKKALTLLRAALPQTDAPVAINYNATSAFFSFGNIKMVCRLIDERYPDYQGVIPNDNNNKMQVDRELLLQALRRVSIFANKTTHQVRLAIQGSQLTISAEDIDFSTRANERLDCTYSGDDTEIGFNARFLIEMLSILEGDEVTLALSTPSRAGLLIPATNDENEDILMLVMPVMLNNYN